MAVITTINAGDAITSSRTVLNANLANLNTDKIETSVLDSDTALTANSDLKVATQKAVKAYVDTGGNTNASTTTRGIVEEATSAEVLAKTATGATGARLFINPSTLQVSETVQTFNSNGTYTKPSGVIRLRVEAWGGGGSGGAATTLLNAAGGGGGGYLVREFLTAAVGATEVVTVGTGGATGANGGTSTFGSLLSAYGGAGGVTSNSALTGAAGASAFAIGGGLPDGGPGGTGTTPSPATSGGGGGGGANEGSSQDTAGGNSIFGGAGGGSARSGGSTVGGLSIHGGAGGRGNHTIATGVNGSAPGGGGGAVRFATSPVAGTGAAGRIVITEYY